MVVEVKKSDNVDKILERAISSIPKPYRKVALPPPREVPAEKILFPPQKSKQKVYTTQELKAKQEELWRQRPELKPENKILSTIKSYGLGVAETVAPVVAEARNMKKDEPFAQLGSMEKFLMITDELLNVKRKDSAIRQVTGEVARFVAGLPVEFGLDVYKGIKEMATGKEQHPSFLGVKPRSEVVKEQQAQSKQLADMITDNKTLNNILTVVSPVITDDLFRVLATTGLAVRGGAKAGQLSKYKLYKTFQYTTPEAKSVVLPQPRTKPKSKLETFLLGKDKVVRELKIPVKDKSGVDGLFDIKKTSKGVKVKLYVDRGYKGKLDLTTETVPPGRTPVEPVAPVIPPNVSAKTTAVTAPGIPPVKPPISEAKAPVIPIVNKPTVPQGGIPVEPVAPVTPPVEPPVKPVETAQPPIETNKNVDNIVKNAIDNIDKAPPPQVQETKEPAILPIKDVIKTIDNQKIKQQTPKFVFKDNDELLFGDYNGMHAISNRFILDLLDSKNDFYNEVRELFKSKRGDHYKEKEVDKETFIDLFDRALKDTEKVENIIGYRKNYNDKIIDVVVVKSPSHEVFVDPKYINYFIKRYGNIELFTSGKHKPLVVKSNGKLVGLIMPRTYSDTEYIKLSKPKETPVEKTQSILPEYNTHKDIVAAENKDNARIIKHFTKEENIAKILEKGFDTSLPPIFGVSGLEKSNRNVEKLGGKDILYFTTDEKRWSSALVYVGEGKGERDYKFYDYENQKWVNEKKALSVINLKPIEAKIKSNANIYKVDNLDQAIKDIESSGNKFNKYEFINQIISVGRDKKADIVWLNNTGKADWTSKKLGTNKYGDSNWYEILTGASGNSDYFVLNKDAIELIKPGIETQVEKGAFEKEPKHVIPKTEKAVEKQEKKPAIPELKLEVIPKEKPINKNDVENYLQQIVIDQTGGKTDQDIVEKIQNAVGDTSYKKLNVDLSKNKEIFNKVIDKHNENYKINKFKRYPLDENLDPDAMEKITKSIKNKEYDILETKTGFRVNFYEKTETGVNDKGYFIEIKLNKNVRTRELGNQTVVIPRKSSDLLFNRTKIKTLLENNKEFMARPVLEVVEDFDLIEAGRSAKIGDTKRIYLQFKGATSSFKLKPEALGLVTDNLKIGEKIMVDVNSFKAAKGEEIRVTKPKAGGGKEFLASKKGASINEIIKRVGQEQDPNVVKDFILSNRVMKIIRHFGSDVAEKHLSRKYAGIYKLTPDKIRVQSLYDITVATHEATHAIDRKTNLINDFISNTTHGHKYRKLLTKIYKEYYPGGKSYHSLNTRMREGLATLIEHYFFNPAEINKKYPELVNLFINPNGEYHVPQIGELLEMMNGVVEDYAKMTPEQRIGSRIRRGEEVVKRNSGFTVLQRTNYETFDRYEPISRFSKDAGIFETEKDPYLVLSVWDAKQAQIYNWIKGKGAIVYVGNGNFELRRGLTVQSYFEKIKGKEKEFSTYLVARRVVFEYNKLQRLKERLGVNMSVTDKIIKAIAKVSPNDREAALVKAGLLEPPAYPGMHENTIKLLNEIINLDKILTKDDFNIQDATAVTSKYQETFKEAEKIYDGINKALLEYLYNTDRISYKQYNTWISEKGYSSFRRFIYDEMIGDGLKKARTVKATPSMLKGRTGSKLDIIDPVYSQVVAIQEGITLGLQNMFWKKMADATKNNIELARRFEYVETERHYDPKTGKTSYPQMNDPTMIPVYIGGKINFFKASPDLIEVAKQLQPKQIDDFGRLLRLFGSIFTRGTTSANPFFVLPNIAVDQFSLAQNTKTKAIPFWDPIKRSVIPTIKEGLSRTKIGKNIKSGEMFEKYNVIGGFRQTLANFLRVAPEDMATTFLGKKTKLGKAIDFIDSGISILELPSNLSEVMSRYAEFERAKRAGASDIKALYLAQEVTVPFNRYGNLGGEFGQTWIKSLPYANASFQVLAKYFRAWHDNPKRVGTVMAGLVLSILATTIAIMKGSNKEQQRTLAQMPVDLLARGFYVPVPGTNKFIRVRIPEQMGAISAIAQLYIIANYTDQKVSMDEWLDASTAWVPQQMDLSEPAKWLFSLIPQAIKPEIEVSANIKTFPNLSAIEPEWYKNQPASKRVYATTTKLAKFIGELTGWSPIKIDYYLRAKFGTIVGVAQRFSTADIKSEYLVEKLGVTGEYYFNSGRLFDHYRSQKKAIELQYNTMKANPDAYSTDEKIEVATIRKRYNKIEEAFSIIREYERDMKKEIPEDIKENVFELLVALDIGDTEKVRDIFLNKLYSRVLELKGEMETK